MKINFFIFIYLFIFFFLVWFYGISTIVRGAYHKFPDFFRMGTFIDSTHMKL